jgi:hypothetical protein
VSTLLTLSKIDPSKIVGLHYELHLKPNMLIKLCIRKYCIEDGLVNGVERIFKTATKSNLTYEVWIEILN